LIIRLRSDNQLIFFLFIKYLTFLQHHLLPNQLIPSSIIQVLALIFHLRSLIYVKSIMMPRSISKFLRNIWIAFLIYFRKFQSHKTSAYTREDILHLRNLVNIFTYFRLRSNLPIPTDIPFERHLRYNWLWFSFLLLINYLADLLIIVKWKLDVGRLHGRVSVVHVASHVYILCTVGFNSLLLEVGHLLLVSKKWLEH
jgi:hypothetical protein